MQKTTNLIWSLLLFFTSALCLNAQNDQQVVTLRTKLGFGKSITIFPKTASKDTPIKIDFGDGKIESKNIDPEQSGYFARFDGVVKGEIIKIYAPLTKLEVDDSMIDSISFSNQDELTFLSLKKNQISKETLDLLGAPNLESIDLSENNMSSFDFRPYAKLKSINLSHNPSVGNILVEGCTDLESIDLSYCDVSVFYPVDLPNLRMINFSHNVLMDLEIGNHYPALTSLNIDHNDIDRIDVSECKELTQLSCNNNLLESLDVSFNLKLNQLNCAYNKLKALNVSNNTKLTGLSCANNDGIRTLDISKLEMLTQLSCDSNKIDYLDLSKALFLKRITASDNDLRFLDFDGNYALQFVDIRGNKNMSACAINFMFMTLPPHNGKTYYNNLLIKGCGGAETSNPAMIEAQNEDQPWQLDVNGDASVKCEQAPIKIVESKHGTATYTQSTNKYGQEYKPITDKAFLGRVIKAEVKADEGYVFKGIRINGEVFPHEMFVVNEKDATVEAVFELPTMMTVNAEIGHEMSLAFAVPEGSEGITIDWGDGQKIPYEMPTQGLRRIDNKAVGETITIEGDIKAAMFDSYPGTGTFDNDLRGIKIQNQPKLERLELFMNPNIRSIDLSGCPNLKVLNCEYNGLVTLDVAHLTKLDTLMCGGNKLNDIDVANLVNLKALNIKGNNIRTIDLSKNTQLTKLEVLNNFIQEITGLDKLTELEMLNASFNDIEKIDLSKNTKLVGLLLSHNKLTSLDLSNNLQIVRLMFDENNIKSLDLSKNTQLGFVSMAGNGMTACELNDFYFQLPEHSEIPNFQLNFDLMVKEAKSEKHNDAEKAASIIAVLKGWKINHEGDGTGCDESYVQIDESENGSISISDKDGKAVKSGDKVKNNTTLVIKAAPAEGYSLEKVNANGKLVQNLDEYLVNGFTVFKAFFKKGAAVEMPQDAEAFRVEGKTIFVDKAQNVALYNMAGYTVYNAENMNAYQISVDEGAYILKIVNNGKINVYKVIVK